MGTPLAAVLAQVGGGPRKGRSFTAAMSGVANPLVPASQFDTPLSHEGMQAIGSGLGAAGFIVFDDATDLAAVAAGVSRFLAVESCGQCQPCKQDGLALARLLDGVRSSQAEEDDLAAVADRVGTVADGARCYLALQHQLVLDSILRLFPEALTAHVTGGVGAVEPVPILPITGIDEAGQFVLDVAQLAKQPDWTFDDTDSGKAPVDRLAEGGAG